MSSFRISFPGQIRRHRQLLLAGKRRKLFLEPADLHDDVAGLLDRREQQFFRDFLRPALDHGDALFGTRHDDLELAFFRLRKVGLTMSCPSMEPMRMAPTGPSKGMSEM